MKNPIAIFIKLLNSDSGKKAWKITDYIVSFTLRIYLIPIVFGLIFSLQNPIGLVFLGMVISSVFPYTEYILIPKIDKKFDIYRNHKEKGFKEMEESKSE